MTISNRVRAPSGEFTISVDNTAPNDTPTNPVGTVDPVGHRQTALGDPFKSPQAARYWVATHLDFDGSPKNPSICTILLAAGQTFPSVHDSVHAQCGAVGGKAIKIVGQADSAGKLSCISGVATKQSGYSCYFGVLWLENLVLEGGSDKSALDVMSNSVVYLKSIRFGKAGAAHVNVRSGVVEYLDGCKIVGPSAYHVVAQSGQVYANSAGTVPIECNLPMKSFAVAAGGSYLHFQGSQFQVAQSRTVSGKKHDVSFSLVIGPTGGFPGSQAGTVNLGGYYV